MFKGDWGCAPTSKTARIYNRDPSSFGKVCPHLPSLLKLSRIWDNVSYTEKNVIPEAQENPLNFNGFSLAFSG